MLSNGEKYDASWRVFRGGGFLDVAWFCRSAYRNWNSPDSRLCNLGFRPVLYSTRRPSPDKEDAVEIKRC